MIPTAPDELLPYIALAKSFVSGEIPPHQFEKRFLRTFKDDQTPFSDGDFEALNRVFMLLEDFCDDPDLFEEGDVTVQMLLDGTRDFIQKYQ